jgi:hypothetical protein
VCASRAKSQLTWLQRRRVATVTTGRSCLVRDVCGLQIITARCVAFFPPVPQRPPQPRWLPLRDSSCSAVSNAHCLGGHCGARTQPDRVHPHPQDRRPGDRGVGPASRPRLGRMPAQGGRTQLASAPRQVWHLHEGLLKLPHPTGRMGGGAHAALRRRRPHLLRRPPPFHARRLRVYLASQVDAVLAHLHAAWSKCLSLQCPSSAPAPFQGASGGSGRLETPTARGQATGRPATALGARASRLKAAHSTAFDHAGTADSLNEFIERVFVSGIDPHGDGDEPAEGGGAAGGAESGAGPPGVGVRPPGPHVPPGLGARLAALRSAGELATMEAPPSELDCHALPQWVYLDGLLPGRPACQVS